MPGAVQLATVGPGLGYAGESAAGPRDLIIQKPVDAGSANIPWGSPVYAVPANNTVTLADGSFSAALFVGIATGKMKQNQTFVPGNNETGNFFAPYSAADIIQVGFVPVFIQRGTSINWGGTVYVRKVLNGAYPNAVVGGFETTGDSTNTVALTNAVWESNYIDANGMALLKLLYPVI